MDYVLIGVAVYVASVLWVAVAAPWFNTQFEDQARWQREQEEIRRQRRLKNAPRAKIIRRVSAKLIADDIVSVQPMTKPVGGIAFYNTTYSRKA